MLDGKRVAVVVPAFDEERLIATTVAGIPEFVDKVIVVDDASRDGTAAAAAGTGDGRVEVITHERNEGVGAAILSGYRRALEDGIDVTCVMAGDNQMDPDDLEAIAGPVARGEVDYAKANRLFTGRAWELIPRTRYLGNAVLSLLTKIASGYWHVADSQSGYTAVGLKTLELLDLDRIYRRYGFPNDMLVHLNVINARVRDVPSHPVYGVGETSGIRLRRVVPSISWLLTKAFFWRMREKYVIRDFHPLVFFYVFGILFSLIGIVLGATVTILRFLGNELTVATVVLVALLLIAGLLFTLFAMLFDMETGSLSNIKHIRDSAFTFLNHDVIEPIEIDEPIDVVYHLAALASPIDYLRQPLHSLKTGSYGTHHAIGLAKWKRARFLLASTSEIYGDPQVHPQPETYWGHVNPIGPRGVYDEAKRYGEAMTMAYHHQQGVDTAIVRIFNTYGPRMRGHDGRAIPTLVRQALENKPLTVFGDGSQTRSFCYVDDLIRGLYLLANSGEHLPVNLGNPREFTILELAETVLRATGSSSEIVFEALPVDDPQVRQPDITRAKQVLGWEPKIELEEGLKRMLPTVETVSA
jgi:dTDP-glucose 4,6-dehydratase